MLDRTRGRAHVSDVRYVTTTTSTVKENTLVDTLDSVS